MLVGSGAGALCPTPLPSLLGGTTLTDYRGQDASIAWNACSIVF